MNDERRHYSRIAFEAPARLIFADCSVKVTCIDLSLKGALIRLPAHTRVENDALCMLEVALGTKRELIRMEASVAHTDDAHVGLAGLSIDLDSVTHLRRLVELNLGDPALLEREMSALLAE